LPNAPSEKGKAATRADATEKPPRLVDLFNKDFGNIGGVTDNGFDLSSSDGGTIHIGRRIFLDFPGKNKFLAFYIPSSRYGFETCLALADIARPMASEFPKGVEVTGGDSGGVTRLQELTFSGRVFIYHERPLSNKQKADVIEAYSAKGLDVQFRGLDYLAVQVIGWDHEHGIKQ